MTRQAEFRGALLDAAAPRPAGLVDGQGRPAGRRYDVYRNNIATSLGEALATGFPAVAKLLGAENFKALAALYLRAAPPDSPRMMLYGAGFGDFLEGIAQLRKYPYLGDVARLEYALRESYHAGDAAALPATALAIAPEALLAARLGLAPSVRLIRSRHPVVSIWAWNMAGGAKPAGGAEDALILRAEFAPVPQVLAPGGHEFLSALRRGETLGTAYDAALARAAEFDLSPLLACLLAGNALTEWKEESP
ncbi:MAG: DUF2063 domain-containing protein [Rhodobacteraceae bacterium]|nr:MAG: DUF2063 domain-containing protein [Paracoccaceae bacterium]